MPSFSAAVAVAGLLAEFLCLLPAARADDGFMNNGAYGPEPRGTLRGEESIVRMESEQIRVRFGRKESTVVARFVFRSAKPDAPPDNCSAFPIPARPTWRPGADAPREKR